MVVVYSHLVAAFREEYLLLGALLRPSTFSRMMSSLLALVVVV